MRGALKKFGLSENEINVYLACLELGSKPVTAIAKKASVYRTLTYEILNGLVDKGLVSSTVKENKKYFEAASPETFISILKDKEREINTIMPELLAIKESVPDKTNITLYEGVSGIRTVFEGILREAKEFCNLAPLDEMLEMFKYYFPHFVDRRIAAGIKVRAITTKKPLTQKLLDYRIIHKKFNTGYWIYNNKLIFMLYHKSNPQALVIEDENYVNLMKINFDIIWDTLSKK